MGEKQVAAYIRVSTDSQLEENSHLRQRESVARWCETRDITNDGWEYYHNDDEIDEDTEWESIDGENTGMIDWFEDLAISGTKDDRPAHNRLMNNYKDYDIVVVKSLSRFGRSPERNTNQIIEISENADFVAIEDPIDTTTANGRLMMRMINAYNGWFAEQRREQAKEMVERRREEGKPIGRPKKLDQSQIEQIREWHENDGLGYSMIAAVVEKKWGESVHRSTVRRYCQPSEV